MSTAPTFAPTDDDTYDLLALVADETSPVGRDVLEIFLAACERDAAAHEGRVSVNRVRDLLSENDIPARRYSSLWSHYTGPGRPMVKVVGEWEVCEGSGSRNDGRPFAVRRWIGETS